MPERPRRPNVPWLVTNPIYVNLRRDSMPHGGGARARDSDARDNCAAREWWRTESSTGSESALDVGARPAPRQLRQSEMAASQIAGGPARSQYAAIAFGSSPRLAPTTVSSSARAPAGRCACGRQLRAAWPRGGRAGHDRFTSGSEDADHRIAVRGVPACWSRTTATIAGAGSRSIVFAGGRHAEYLAWNDRGDFVEDVQAGRAAPVDGQRYSGSSYRLLISQMVVAIPAANSAPAPPSTISASRTAGVP